MAGQCQTWQALAANNGIAPSPYGVTKIMFARLFRVIKKCHCYLYFFYLITRMGCHTPIKEREVGVR
jgi:hypothetical protein